MRKSSELVISNHPDINFTEVEVLVEDVQQTYESLKDNKDVKVDSRTISNRIRTCCSNGST